MVRNKYPILISIPHGSTFVPVELRRLMNLTDFQIKKQSDPFTDDIFDVPNAHIVKGKISRLVVDLNRAPDDIEMEHTLSNKGVVVSIDIDGETIYKTPPSVDAIFTRVKKYHYAFHEAIEELKPKVKFMIDGHSMRSISPATKPDSGTERADIVLGNRDFTTCSHIMTRKIMKFFEEKGFTVKINEPFAGKFVIGYHCSRKMFPGIQVEINEKLFLNTKTYRPYKKKVLMLRDTMAELVEMVHNELQKIEGVKNNNGVMQGKLF